MPGALTHHLLRRTAYKIQNGCQGAPKWQWVWSTFAKEVFDSSTSSVRKVEHSKNYVGDGGSDRDHYIIVSQLPNNAPTAHPHILSWKWIWSR